MSNICGVVVIGLACSSSIFFDMLFTDLIEHNMNHALKMHQHARIMMHNPGAAGYQLNRFSGACPITISDLPEVPWSCNANSLFREVFQRSILV